MKERADQRKYHFIYKTTCLVTGKEYYGMHSTDEMKDRYLGSGKLLKLSINKHGRKNHVREILEDGFLSRESLRQREAEIVDDHKLKDSKCMNLILGGTLGSYGKEFSDLHRQRISAALKGRKLPDDVKEKISVAGRNRAFSEEVRRKISESNRGLKRSEETRQRIVKSVVGRKLSEEHRRSIGQGGLGRRHSPETIERMREARRRYWAQRRERA